MNIEDLEHQFEQAVQPLIPQGFRPRVTIHGPKQKRRKDASVDNWSPEDDEIRICFEPAPAASLGKPEERRSQSPTTEVGGGTVWKRQARDPLSDLICALDRAESRPGFEFVALKWFRDVALKEEGHAWAESDPARQTVLRDAIEKRLILVGRIPNPRSPQFPVTTVRLNRLLPEVQAMLRTAGQGTEDFEPVDIRGERLSTTILRERR
jgi:hypothetical protein